MTTEASAGRAIPANETTPVRGLGLAPVRPDYHRWPEDDRPMRNNEDAGVVQALCLVLGQFAWRRG